MLLENGKEPNGTVPNGLLRGRTALVYGAGGPVGGAVARAFAAEGADVFLAGRTESRLLKVARDIREAGGVAETAVVDALDETQVNAFVDQAAKKSRRIDVSFNLISYGDVQQPLMDISADDFTQPINAATRTHFLTTRAAARHMIRQRSGVVLMFGGSGPRPWPGWAGSRSRWTPWRVSAGSGRWSSARTASGWSPWLRAGSWKPFPGKPKAVRRSWRKSPGLLT
ncbi:SDR family NAD(P)-dependent oxidoreductase [Arthrobacter sp. 24S4-2]|uniref:SDR family NAD(P)-dependent oxidoreductase n=1 Tax=Arthrobacter sp. 24S4-2 TaxID=2575374 RepID=UPI0020C77414|nr:SDR family NAD(P)-dependent oxidoreductase [Arthrobacter sp. 24S4-2]